MATYESSGYYRLSYDTITNTFIVSSEFMRSTYILSTDEANDEFVVGDSINLKDASGMTVSVPLRAFVSDGMIVRSLTGVSEWVFYSTNSGYELMDVLVISTTPPPPVCFVQGTQIESSRGSIPIESLVVGDLVIGSTGWRTVKWIGWRHYHAVSLRTPEQRAACMPVRIQAGACGEHMPSQDLRVSPWHHLYIDGVLIRAKDLINGQTIVQELDCPQFSYYHVELDQFDVIRAHGMYSESWADGGNRDFFQNVDVTRLRPEDRQRRQASRPGFKVLRKPEDIAKIFTRIRIRAETLFQPHQIKVA